jgi:3-hydroxymyristoyl/3-hydroxydecanoyl-(acyl carrier protein) dehydratase
VIFDERELVEFATGSASAVLGPRFAAVDTFARRTRVPAPPYLFISRVTELEAETGRFGPSMIVTEYDIPHDAWFLVDGQVPVVAVTEMAGQGVLLLASYLGIDLDHRGERGYRLLDGALVPHTWVHPGQTVRAETRIERFARTSGPTLFWANSRAYVDGELVVELRDELAGYFTYAELDLSRGLAASEVRRGPSRPAPLVRFKPLARTPRSSLDRAAVDRLTRGEIAEVFGPAYRQDGCRRSIRLPANRLLMIDEVRRLSHRGGTANLGAVTAVKGIHPDDWIFKCHFPDDPVVAGPLAGEGSAQVIQIFAVYAGLHLCLPDATFAPIPDLTTMTKVRGSLTPDRSELRYEASIVDIGLLPRPYVIGDVVIYADDEPVASARGVGVQIVERPGTPWRPERGGLAPNGLGRRTADGRPALVNELHIAHLARGDATALGPEFDLLAGRPVPKLPAGDMCLVDRLMEATERRGAPAPGAAGVCELDVPDDAWYLSGDGRPYLPAAAVIEASVQPCALFSLYLGTTLTDPDQDFTGLNLDGQVTVHRAVDPRGRTIRQQVVLRSSDAVSGMIVQRYECRLSVGDEALSTAEVVIGHVARDGNARDGRSRGTGLDRGRHTRPWLDDQQPRPATVQPVDLAALRQRRPVGLPTGRLDLLDHLDVLPGGGRYGAGYLRGSRVIRADDWFFPLHFHEYPVVPGSFTTQTGVAALQAYALHTGLADALSDPRFAPALDVPLRWRYRGQFGPDDERMDVEVHVKETRVGPDSVVVIGDASVWRGALRVHQSENVAVRLRAAGAAP